MESVSTSAQIYTYLRGLAVCFPESGEGSSAATTNIPVCVSYRLGPAAPVVKFADMIEAVVSTYLHTRFDGLEAQERPPVSDMYPNERL